MERLSVVTEELRSRALFFGACAEGVPSVGTLIEDLSPSQLAWAHVVDLLTAEERELLGAPIWAVGYYGSYGGRSGYGDSGYGGVGYGYGGVGYGGDYSGSGGGVGYGHYSGIGDSGGSGYGSIGYGGSSYSGRGFGYGDYGDSGYGYGYGDSGYGSIGYGGSS